MSDAYPSPAGITDDRSEPNRVNPIVVGAFVLGVVLLIIHQLIPGGIWKDLVRDFGIGCLVAVLVYFCIEARVHMEREWDTKARVLKQFFGEMMDQDLWDDLLTKILAKGIVCDEWELKLSIEKQHVVPDPLQATPGAQAADQFVSVGVQRYKLRNCSRTVRPVAIRHELQYIVVGQARDGHRIPRFTGLKYVVREPNRTPYTVDLPEQALIENNVWTGKELLEKVIQLGPGGVVEVELGREEVVDVPGEFPWYVFWLTKNPKLELSTPQGSGLACHVLLRHHEGVRWEPRSPGNWLLPTVILPGQGFALMTRSEPGAGPS